MTSPRDMALQYAADHYDEFLASLRDLLTIPSISTDESRKPDIARAAEFLAERLRSLGMENVKIYPTSHHPVVYGEWLGAGADAPTVLMYGHYDVQPPDPLDLWESPPFEPTQRGESLYARGASDMKGQVFATLSAVESIVRTGTFPVNIKWIFEGEEEIGSPSLPEFISEYKEMLAADFCLNPDSGMIAPDAPTITYALRGLAYFEIRVYGPDHDLHSGIYGGVVANPANVLAKLIAGMHDDEGRVTLPGFYDKVRPLDEEERAALARLPMNESYYLEQTGAPTLGGGEKGFSPVERAGARPTLDVNGMLSGFTGEGAKTVLPAKAMAKISMRLVPDQDPEEVYEQLKAYMEANAPDSVRWEILVMHGGKPSISSRENIGVRALSKAMKEVWGVAPLFKREGGSIPIVGQMQEILGLESVLTGFGLPDDRIHAPNEKLNLTVWRKGIETLIRFFFALEK